MMSLHSNDVAARNGLRDKIASDTVRFLSSGGSVYEADVTERAELQTRLSFDSVNVDRARKNGGKRGQEAQHAAEVE